jgi:hypothetical protein
MNEKERKVYGVIQGLIQSGQNVVIFENTPEVWFQFWLGLYFGLPTLVVIKKADHVEHREDLIGHGVEDFVIVKDFDTESMEFVAKSIKDWWERLHKKS